jgi:hypothetical protein
MRNDGGSASPASLEDDVDAEDNAHKVILMFALSDRQ